MVAKIPQISKKDYLKRLAEAGFNSDIRAVMHTDATPTFVGTGHLGIVDHHSVNHSANEFVRSVEVLANVETRKMRPGSCSTNMIDREWRALKNMLPEQLSAKSEAKRDQASACVHSCQWRRMTAGLDQWKEFCQAASLRLTRLRSPKPNEPGCLRMTKPCPKHQME